MNDRVLRKLKSAVQMRETVIPGREKEGAVVPGSKV